MNKILSIFFLIYTMCGCKAQDTKTDQEIIYSEIHFQDFFRNDTVSLYVNNCLVFDKQIANSDKALGLTKLQVKIINDKKSFKCYFHKNEVDCEKKNIDNMLLKVVINEKKYEFIIDMSQGKYIGFNKSNNSSISIIQSKSYFLYD